MVRIPTQNTPKQSSPQTAMNRPINMLNMGYLQSMRTTSIAPTRSTKKNNTNPSAITENTSQIPEDIESLNQPDTE